MSLLEFIPYLFGLLLIFALTIFVGFEVISKVPTTLHTPLMSATNAIHGVVLVGAIFIVGEVFGLHSGGPLLPVIAFIAVLLGTINVVGGFAVTERMLQMFKKKEPVKK
ncbi:MAG TPA: NAD(P) transhydrogenase subunit alpha [Candidatus Baltobacteraceae bacterium]|jgi:NAD(P) transhydrogenase subunit alpha|nr:NAD(P) transhydrogenase subunit alpha [Candidatus Baltobacteraceae bacterium]